MKSIAEIKEELNSCDINNILELAGEYASDERAGVKKLVIAAGKKYQKHLAELERLEQITQFERHYWEQGVELVGGIDEVGRGPFAGPVVTACVILPKGCIIEGINDSKKLSKAKREELYDIIISKALSYGIGMVDNYTIDDINILQATYKAMREAISKMDIKPQQLLVDAVHIPDIDIPQAGIIKGDAKSISIGAASIVAKVTRDRLMEEYARIYPQYGFERNMGYGTAEHIAAIEKNGLCDIHRRSFAQKFCKE